MASSKLTPGLRKLHGRIGAYEKWANTEDRTAATEPARKAFNRRFEDAADPESARKAYFTRLALASAESPSEGGAVKSESAPKGAPEAGAAKPQTRRHLSPNGGRGVDALTRLASYREAAQAIRRLDAPFGKRCARMIGLMQQARAEGDPWTRALAEQVIYAQAQWMLEGDEAIRRNGIRGRIEKAARRLRLKGYECCPECEQRLTDPSDWAFWAALRRAELDRLAALEREAGEAA